MTFDCNNCASVLKKVFDEFEKLFEYSSLSYIVKKSAMRHIVEDVFVV